MGFFGFLIVFEQYNYSTTLATLFFLNLSSWVFLLFQIGFYVLIN
jgi:hypothetical protein